MDRTVEMSTLPRVAVIDGCPDLLRVSADAFLPREMAASFYARRQLFDLLQEAIVLVGRDAIVREWNRAMVQLSGICRDEAVGRKLFALVPADFEKNLAGPLVQVFLYETPCEGEFTQHHADNEFFSFQYRVARIDTVDSHDLAVISLVDKSDRDRVQRQLKKQEHLSMLGKLSASIAYELATPLDAICSTIDNIFSSLENLSNGRVEMGLQRILDEVYRISHLSNNIVTLARNDAPHVLPVDPHALLGESISALEQALNRRPVCNVRFSRKSTAVLADPVLLRCALQNILKNAIDAAGDDAIPLVETSFDKLQRFVIRVEDRDQHATGATAPQFLASPPAKNSEHRGCFGLFLSKKIVEVHKGHIQAKVQAGHGTVYIIALPTGGGAAKAQKRTPAEDVNL